MTKTERGISLIVLLTGLALVTIGPLRRESEAAACEALEELEAERLEHILDELIEDGATVDAATLEAHGVEDVPEDALPCLQQRLEERLAAAPVGLSFRS